MDTRRAGKDALQKASQTLEKATTAIHCALAKSGQLLLPYL
jgi:hypothetical protein